MSNECEKALKTIKHENMHEKLLEPPDKGPSLEMSERKCFTIVNGYHVEYYLYIHGHGPPCLKFSIYKGIW
jgi:hypothetical protein